MSDTTAETDDIRSALSAAFEAAEEPVQATPAPAEAKGAPEPAAAPEAAAQEPDKGRPRGPDGKFIKPDDEPAATTQPPAAAAKQDEPPATTEKPAEDPLAKATATWTEADKAMLRALPPDAQQFVIRRHQAMETAFTKKMQEQSAFRREYEPIDQMFAPHRAVMQASNFTPAALIEGWIGAERALMDPAKAPAFIAEVLPRYKIDRAAVVKALGGVMPGSPGGEQPLPAPDGAPQHIALPPEVERTLTDLSAWKAEQVQAAQRAQQQQFHAAATRVMSDIETFKSATNDAGGLLHPYFADVEADMALLADIARARGERPDLNDLYERAVWANTSIRERMLADQRAADEAQRAQAEQKRQQEARAKAEQARKAAAPVTGTANAGPTQARRRQADSVREALEDALEETEAA